MIKSTKCWGGENGRQKKNKSNNNKEKTVTKIVEINTMIPIITLNVNGVQHQLKDRDAKEQQKRPNYMLSINNLLYKKTPED